MESKSVVVKVCPECGGYLIPYGDTFLHSDIESNCECADWIRIHIDVSKPYQDKYGSPKASFDDLMDRLSYLEKSWLKRLYLRFKAIFR